MDRPTAPADSRTSHRQAHSRSNCRQTSRNTAAHTFCCCHRFVASGGRTSGDFRNDVVDFRNGYFRHALCCVAGGFVADCNRSRKQRAASVSASLSPEPAPTRTWALPSRHWRHHPDGLHRPRVRTLCVFARPLAELAAPPTMRHHAETSATMIADLMLADLRLSHHTLAQQ